jgi:hypothetical protein
MKMVAESMAPKAWEGNAPFRCPLLSASARKVLKQQSCAFCDAHARGHHLVWSAWIVVAVLAMLVVMLA